MKNHVVSIVVVLAVLIMAYTGFAQDEESASQTEQWQNMRRRWQNMPEAEKEKFRAEMRERFGARRGRMGREEQLQAIKVIEEQVSKLKKAVESMAGPEAGSRFQELSEEERAKQREKMMAAVRERQTAIRAIQQELSKLRAPGRPGPEPQERIGELRAIHELAVKEKATETAKRLEKLIAKYQIESQGRVRPPEPGLGDDVQRPRRGRPMRQEKTQEADSGKKAPEFNLKSFDGKTISLSDCKGKTVVLEWFNFECPFVQHHYDKATTMVDLAKKYKSKNVVWLAVNSTSHTTPEANREFGEKHKLPYPILDDRSGEVGRAYGARATPHMFIISPKGNIVYEGAIDNSPQGRIPGGAKLVNYVGKALVELTAGKEVSTPSTRPYGCSVKYSK